MIPPQHQQKFQPLQTGAESHLVQDPTTESNAQSVDHLQHELHVHQIEQEMQNEELRRAQLSLERSRDRYVDLYEFAPVGYLTINGNGVIAEINLKASTMLGFERINLISKRFPQFIADVDKERWYRQFLHMKTMAEGEEKSLELLLVTSKKSTLDVTLNCLRIVDVDEAKILRIALTDISDRKRAEATLKSEAFQRSILNSVPVEIAVLDHDGFIVAVNEPWLRFAKENSADHGKPASGCDIGDNYLRACRSGSDLPLDDGAIAVDGIQKVLDGRLPFFHFEYPCDSPQQQRWFSMSVTPLGQTGQVGVVIAHTDITERKLAELEQRIAATAFESQEGMMITDANCSILKVNRAFTNITGYDPVDVTGESPHMLSSGQHDANFYAAMWETIHRSGGWDGEILDRRKNGEIYPQHLTITAVKNEYGSTTNYVGSIIDISERRKIEDSLRNTESRLKLAKRAAGLGIFDRDLIKGTLFLDERAHELLGLDPAETISYEEFEATIHPDDRESRKTNLHPALDPSSHGEYHSEFRIIWPTDASTHWMAATARVFFESGKPVRTIGILRDISEQKQIEKEKTEQLNAMDYLQKLKISAVTVSSIAHELNQPLAAISAYSEVALEALDREVINPELLRRALKGCVEQSQRAGKSLHELINTTVEKGVFAIEPINLNSVVMDATHFAQHDRLERCKLVLDLDSRLPLVLANRIQVQKVLVNLLSNSIEALGGEDMLGRDITITVKTGVENNMAQLSVQDTGPGIDTIIAKQIFEPFFTTKTDGLGIGLPISRSLIESNGGQLWLDQDTESGPKFNFTLPFAS